MDRIKLCTLGISAAFMVVSAACGTGGGTTGTGGGSTTTSTGTAGGAPSCGDAHVDPGEECDDGALNADTGVCTTQCKNAACGDGFFQMGEECDEGPGNADTGTCTTTCRKPACGDGFLQAGEDCDLGAKNDDHGTCTTVCKTAACGDGLVHKDIEECDDGVNNGDAAACTKACKKAVCGDGLVGPDEECDLGALNLDTGACTTSCASAACGDGFLQAGEDCDLGALNADTGACTKACVQAACGDGLVEIGVEQCDLGALNADTGACTTGCKTAACGDGLVGPNEQCDLGAANSDTGACTTQCTSATCGDGFLQLGEQCDNGAANSDTAACTSACKTAACGDGLVQQGVEQCDHGAANSNTDACTVACKNAVCGDSFIHSGVEECDLGLGNNNAGACTLACKNAVCGDGFTGPGEFCDDGNQTNDDVCNTTCTAAGTVLWTGTANIGGGTETWYGSATDALGNVYFVGSSPNAGQGLNMVVQRYNQFGTLAWASGYNGVANGDDEGYGITIGPGNVVLVIGYETVAGQGKNILVRALTSEGAATWARRYGGAGSLDDVGYGIATNATGQVFITGSISNAVNGKDIYVAKVSGFDGTPIFQTTIDGAAHLDDEGRAITVDTSGNPIVTGYMRGAVSNDIWTRKYSDAGMNLVATWTRLYNGVASGSDIGYGVATDVTGNVVIAGAETVANQGLNMWIRKLDSAGNTVWTQGYDAPAHLNDIANGVSVDPSGYVVVGGTITNADATTDGFVRKYSPAGVALWTSTYDGPAFGNDGVNGVNATSNGEIYACGFETKPGPEGQDNWQRRYAP